MENENGFVKGKLACNVCGGSDPAALNANGSSYCFHCSAFYKYGENLKQEDKLDNADRHSNAKGHTEEATIIDIKTLSSKPVSPSGLVSFAQKKEPNYAEKHTSSVGGLYSGQYNELKDRGISAKTARAYGVKSKLNSDDTMSEHVYPFFENHEVSAIKIRGVKDKSFRWHGTPNNTGLFGEQLFSKGGKYLTITEGECDAMSTYELFEGK